MLFQCFSSCRRCISQFGGGVRTAPWTANGRCKTISPLSLSSYFPLPWKKIINTETLFSQKVTTVRKSLHHSYWRWIHLCLPSTLASWPYQWLCWCPTAPLRLHWWGFAQSYIGNNGCSPFPPFVCLTTYLCNTVFILFQKYLIYSNQLAYH